MDISDHRQFYTIAEPVRSIKLAYLQAEAYLISPERVDIRRNKIEAIIGEIKQKLADTDTPRGREILQKQIEWQRAYHDALTECLDMQQEQRNLFINKQASSYVKAHITNCTLFVLDQVINKVQPCIHTIAAQSVPSYVEMVAKQYVSDRRNRASLKEQMRIFNKSLDECSLRVAVGPKFIRQQTGIYLEKLNTHRTTY